MDFEKEISENKIVLLTINRENYHRDIIKAIGLISKSCSRICYICVNDPYSFVSSSLEKSQLNPKGMFFIDTITKKVQAPPPSDNCIFVSAPNSLTEINLAFSKAVSEQHCDCTFFDSLSSIMIYDNAHSIVQFIHNMLTKLRISNGRAFFVALKDDSGSELVKDLYMFVDKAIEI